ncbi:unnamed protein product [Closterium sp. NIES-65]|nr:unnamed protein product [Closterium sp. NIES-65]
MTGQLPSPANRTRFKTPEGRYLLSHEKVHPAGLIQYTHQRNPTKITLAYLEDRPPPLPPPSPSPVATSAGSRFAKNFLGAGSGTRGLPFGGGNGRQSAAAPAASGASAGTGSAGASNGAVGGAGGAGGAGEKEKAGGEGEGSYVIFNVGESLFVADANSTDKEPLKALQFMGASGLCHAFDGAVASREAQGTAGRDAHDLLIATTAGDIYTASLRAQLADGSKKLVGAAHYSPRDGTGSSSGSGGSSSGGGKEGSGGSSSRCTAVAWVPGGDGLFVTAHADGNVYVFDKHRDGTTEAGFPPIKDVHAFSTAHARSNKSNPLARWHISPSSINALAFSPSGSHLATVSRDGYLRVYDWEREALEGGCKSYYGAFLCCAFSSDGRLVAAGGEDDLVAVWDRHSHSVLAWSQQWRSTPSSPPRPPTHPPPSFCLNIALSPFFRSALSLQVTAVAFDPFLSTTPPQPPPSLCLNIALSPFFRSALSLQVTAVAFDPFLPAIPPPPSTTAAAAATPPSSSSIPTSSASTGSGAGGGVVVAAGGAEGSYRLGSVGQDTQLLLWDIALDDVVLPLRLHASHPHHQSAAATSASHPHDVASTRTPPTAHPHSRSHFSHFHSHAPGHASPNRTHGATSASPSTSAATSASSLGLGRSSGARSSSGAGSGAGGAGSSSSSGGGVGSGGGSSSGALRDASASNASHASNAAAVLVPPPSRKDVPRISPVMAHKVHVEPLSALVFSQDAVLTACHEGCVKLWLRPGATPPPGSIAATSTPAPSGAGAAPVPAAGVAAAATAAVPAASASPLRGDPQSASPALHLSDRGPASHRTGTAEAAAGAGAGGAAGATGGGSMSATAASGAATAVAAGGSARSAVSGQRGFR